MSFSDPLSITYNAAAKATVRVNQDANGSDFYLDGGTAKYSISIRHTRPNKVGIGESHMVRLDVDEFDANGIYVRRGSVWLAAKSYDQAQNSTTLGYAVNALVGLLTTTNVAKLLAREV